MQSLPPKECHWKVSSGHKLSVCEVFSDHLRRDCIWICHKPTPEGVVLMVANNKLKKSKCIFSKDEIIGLTSFPW